MKSKYSIECAIENTNDEYDLSLKEWTKITQDLFKNLVSHKEICSNYCLKGLDFDKIFFDVTFTDGIQTHELNREYRKKDSPADIITFALFADSEEKFVTDGEIVLGDIVLALDKVEEFAKEKGNTFDYELKFLIAHGILHLLGFDHQTEDEYNFVVKHQTQAIEELENE